MKGDAISMDIETLTRLNQKSAELSDSVSAYQPQMEAIMRVQEQLAAMGISVDTLTRWTKLMQNTTGPLQSAQTALQVVGREQLRAIAQNIHSPEMIAAIRSALAYLEHVHPDIYREFAPDDHPYTAPSRPLRQKQKPRRRAIHKAARLTSRGSDILMRLNDRIQAIPSGRLSNIISLILSAGSIAQPEHAHSIGILCLAIAAFLTFYHKE